MANFQKAMERLINVEGYVSNHVQDRGGYTIFGISEKVYPIDVSAMKNMSRQEALKHAEMIYKRDYWDKLRLNEIIDQDIANSIFDMAVNAGIKNASLMIQNALKGLHVVINIDGIIGEKTIEAINSFEYKKALINEICYFRIVFYKGLVNINPSQRIFYAGWLNRI